jgi:transcriptional regulator with XRE-family HTH domain
MKVTLNGHSFDGQDPLITGTDLRILRLKGNKSTVDMAEVAAVKTRKTYENWEAGKGKPNINQFMALSVYCGFDPGLLVSEFARRGNTSFSGADHHAIDWESCLIK